ncbi:MAG: ATP-binding protein, partial [Arenibacterium sp.]
NPAQTLAMLAAGRIDMTTLLAKTPERQALGLFTRSVGGYQTSIFVRANSPFRTLDDLNGTEIGAVAGSFALHSIEAVKSAIPVPYPESDALITPLMLNQLDAVVAPEETFWSRLHAIGVSNGVRTFDAPLMHIERGFLIHPDQQTLLQDLNRAIESQLSALYLKSLKEKWFGRSARLVDNWLFPWMAVVVIASTALVVSLSNLAWRAIRRERGVRAQYEAERLFLEAMDHIDASIIVFDKDLNAKVWNRGFQSAFPESAAIIRRGEPMARILNSCGAHFCDDYFFNAPKARITTEAILGRMLSGQETARLLKLENGRVFEAHEFGIGYDHYAAVRVDVTSLHRQAIKINEQKEELKRVNDKLKIFSTVAAHDLRAPVNQLDALLDFVIEDFKDARIELPADAATNLNLIRQISDRMGNLIEDLLVYARSEGTSEAVEPILPSDRLRDVALLAAVPDSFRVDIAPGIPTVHLPPVEFDTVFRNLIVNAVKHHDRASGKITIRGYQEDACFVFEVEDDGPGIPAQSLEEIFDPFKRLKATTETSGSGLGLSFIRKSVEGWGGTVTAISHEDRGTLFRIRLPGRTASPNALEQISLHAPPEPRTHATKIAI